MSIFLQLIIEILSIRYFANMKEGKTWLSNSSSENNVFEWASSLLLLIKRLTKWGADLLHIKIHKWTLRSWPQKVQCKTFALTTSQLKVIFSSASKLEVVYGHLQIRQFSKEDFWFPQKWSWRKQDPQIFFVLIILSFEQLCKCLLSSKCLLS